MSRKVPLDQPLSDEDRAYLQMRGDEGLITRLDQQFPPQDAEADEEEEEAEEADLEDDEDEDDEDEDEDVNASYEEWTIAELKVEIDRRNAKGAGLAVSGTKPDLATRLREHDEAQ